MISAFRLKSRLPAPQQALACARFEVYTPSVPDENPMTVVEDQPNQLVAQGVKRDVKRLFVIARAKSSRAAIHRVIGPRRPVNAVSITRFTTWSRLPQEQKEVKPSSSPSRELTPAAGRACSSHVQNRRNERADGKRSDEHLLGAAQEVVKEDPDSDRGVMQAAISRARPVCQSCSLSARRMAHHAQRRAPKRKSLLQRGKHVG
jgi:hypothetical protein